ncbi:alkaline phosphatase synthesis sensor protein PhoR [Oxobacter pfennigii]|uniref:histidine kinase n=1 Tax=Oxobacter pfennigii TaxID=36849 RepID=A0A0P8WPV9_9CLOT|nr:HAMP domain-containing sensor histidine kinase [Oxobacter pfennigii]KPU44597.1 alkaline phosphatase synthesis sensor protein PhoR [Oxobacter pfennigii]
MSDKLLMRLKITISILGFVTAIMVCVIAAHFLLGTFFTLATVADIAASVWIGFVLFAIFSWILHTAAKLSHRNNERNSHWEEILAALEQISRGNFSVFLPESEDIRFTGFAKAVNDMAKNLGDLDKMRQDFISNVSHEIQSPLTSIGGFAALIKTDLPEDERRRYAGIIETESRRLSGLSDNLMKLSSLDNNQITRRDFRLDKQLQNVILALEPQWAVKNIILEADLEKTAVNGDEGLLSQAWTNLLHNAIKFTPQGGIIYVSLKSNTIIIADTGCGIPKEDLPHIFERFYKADKARNHSLGGNGLGLSIVKKIIGLHGWTIEVESELKKGTRFAIRLS